MQVRTLLVEAGRELAAAGVPDALLEARVLTGHALDLNRVQLITEATRDVAQEAILRVRAAVARRASGEPLAHITGQREFYGRPFRVTPYTLVPRPETELLVEESLQRLPQGGCFADWGTGSGCVGITLAAERPDCRGLLLDYSAEALSVARENARALGVATRLRLIRGDMLRPCLGGNRFDVICSNPPYIAPQEVLDVMPEVRRHEPAQALFSEDNGLRHIRALIAGAGPALKPGGWLLLEHGAGQGATVREALAQGNFAAITTQRDLAGQERCSLGQKINIATH